MKRKASSTAADQERKVKAKVVVPTLLLSRKSLAQDVSRNVLGFCSTCDLGALSLTSHDYKDTIRGFFASAVNIKIVFPCLGYRACSYHGSALTLLKAAECKSLQSIDPLRV